MLADETPLIPEKTLIEDKELFVASQPESLEDFFKTEISIGKHIYCSFPKEQFDGLLTRRSKQRQIKSIRFSDGEIVYPCE